MRLHTLLLSGSVAALMAAFSVPATAAMARACECVPGKATAASYTYDFKGEANRLFQDIQSDALQARNQADKLENMSANPLMDWQFDTDKLTALRAEVNDMGAKVCRLETIRSAVAPWQQAEIDRIGTMVRLMADNTEDAIVFVNGHQNDLWLPTYQKYTHNLYSEARNLTHSTSDAVAYANVSKEYRGLRHDLGTRSSS